MNYRTRFIPYHPKSILNKAKRADHWFWTRYSAYPYIGCQHGCEFCYCRERKYSPYEDPADFAYKIKVKENAAALLKTALQRTPIDLIFTGDYQPAERKYQISRQMLEVCCDLGFPVFILERNPLVTRDLDLIQAIHRRSPSVVAFSIISTPELPHYERIQQMEHLAPPPEKRFAAMEAFARAGIMTGICFMPVLPGLCDDAANIKAVVRWTAEHGGKFVLAGGLTLADQLKDYFFNVLRGSFPYLADEYQRIYPTGSYAAVGEGERALALRVREAAQKHGILDRIPRPIIPGDKRQLNKRVVELLANQVYEMMLNNEPEARIWAQRKAAWSIEDLEQDIGLIYRTMGAKGLESIPNVGAGFAKMIQDLIKNNLF